MKITLAAMTHLSDLARLFDQYRVFYQQPSDEEGARSFLRDRFVQKDSKIFIAVDDQEVVGFLQLYPSFSSVSMQPIWILNDLYVTETHRRTGAATALMDAAENDAKNTGAIRIELSTQCSNTVAQALYLKRGYQRDEEFWHYSLSLGTL